jgi:hypothetical protein
MSTVIINGVMQMRSISIVAALMIVVLNACDDKQPEVYEFLSPERMEQALNRFLETNSTGDGNVMLGRVRTTTDAAVTDFRVNATFRTDRGTQACASNGQATFNRSRDGRYVLDRVVINCGSGISFDDVNIEA